MQRFFSKMLSKNDTPLKEERCIQGYLTGQTLIASPFMEDARFVQSVVYICGHDENGAMGFILNKPLPSMNFHGLLDQLNISHPPDLAVIPVLYGGPMDMGRGFVLHSTDYKHAATVAINDAFSITATLEILKEIAQTTIGPKEFLLTLGYTGWIQGQLESELQKNQWFVMKGSKDFVYHTPAQDMWSKAYEHLGIDPHLISFEGGVA